MKVPARVNLIRGRIMKGLTKDIGKSSVVNSVTEPVTIKKILISRPNKRLGNLLLITPLLQEVTSVFPDCTIDLFIGGDAAPDIFKSYNNINRIILLPKKPFSNLLKYIRCWIVLRLQRYDLAINACENSSSGRLSTIFSRARYKFFGEPVDSYNNNSPDYYHHAKYPVFNFRRFLLRLGYEDKENEIPVLDLKLTQSEIVQGNNILKQIVPNNNRTICLFTNATGNKCYPESWWNDFYHQLKAKLPHYNFIELLPVEKISRLGYRIPTFYTKKIREMGSLIANCSLFIAADSGVMHLASASGTTTIGLFSVTDKELYKPYNKHSIAINTNEISMAEILNLIEKIAFLKE